ncbi:MAG: hypothetical protein LUQ18_10070 [Methylococcaceae bacterium]|nr:hypothetical protein [Methylococcaceae bacterium]
MTAADITALVGAVDFAAIKGGLLTLFTGMAGIAALTFAAHKILSNVR